MSVQVAVNLPPDQYRALSQIATKRGINAHTLIEQLVTHALRPKPQPVKPEGRLSFTERLAEIRRLHATGLKDWQIGEQVGLSPSGVAFHRQKMHLPANSKCGRKFNPNQIERKTA